MTPGATPPTLSLITTVPAAIAPRTSSQLFNFFYFAPPILGSTCSSPTLLLLRATGAWTPLFGVIRCCQGACTQVAQLQRDIGQVGTRPANLLLARLQLLDMFLAQHSGKEKAGVLNEMVGELTTQLCGKVFRLVPHIANDVPHAPNGLKIRAPANAAAFPKE
jgi:hypothetical protein